MGETLIASCHPSNPLSGAVLSGDDGYSAVAEFWAAGTATSEDPDETQAMDWDGAMSDEDGNLGLFLAYVDTSTWSAGKWTWRARISGSIKAWDFAHFTLRPAP